MSLADLSFVDVPPAARPSPGGGAGPAGGCSDEFEPDRGPEETGVEGGGAGIHSHVSRDSIVSVSTNACVRRA